MRIQANHQRGHVLVTTLIITGLVTIVVAALLAVVQQQNYFTARSMTWCAEIPMAEAGIEEALAHLNSKPAVLAINGWTVSGSNVVKSRYFTNGSATLADGYFYTAISTASPPVIVSIGYGRIPQQTNYTQRMVLVTTRTNSPSYGIIAKLKVGMSGGAYIDSFDSSNPLYSTGGLYDAAKREDHAVVASQSSLTPAIDSGTGKIYGQAATGPGGTAAGTIGDGVWNANNANNNQTQPGHFRNDFNMAIPDVKVPFAGGLPLPSAVGGVTTVPTGDYLMSNVTVPGGKSMLITGNVRLYVNDKFEINGSGFVKIAPGGSLQVYIGKTGIISGSAIVNDTQNARNCAIYGMPTCTTLTYSGSTAYIGTVYAPQANFTLSGSTDVFGSFVANSFNCSGSMGIHYDEALGNPYKLAFEIVSWEEL